MTSRLAALSSLFVAPRDEHGPAHGPAATVPAPTELTATEATPTEATATERTPTRWTPTEPTATAPTATGSTATEPVVIWQPPAAGRGPALLGDAGAGEAGAAGVQPQVASDPEPVSAKARDAGGGPAHAAVLGTGAIALAAAVAGELRARHRARTALLLIWDPSAAPPVAVPAWPHAREVAASLAHENAVTTRGRLVEVRLPRDPSAAAAAAARLARLPRVPSVLVLGFPRVAAFDDLLAGRDPLVVADVASADGAVTALATAELRRLNARVMVAAPGLAAGRRLTALSGLGRARFLGDRVDADPA